MPQLDFIIVSSQVFWLIITFLVLYVVLTHFFLPNFIKILKTRKHVLQENTIKLLNLKKKLRNKQRMFDKFIEDSLIKIKILIEGDIFSSFKNTFFIDLIELNKKASNALYFNLMLYDINILKSIPVKPMF